MLDRASWWHHAEALELGQKRRVPHDCGDGRTLIVSRNHDGYHAWCFRCNDGGGAPPPVESLHERLQRIRLQRAADLSIGGSFELPSPMVRDVAEWPESARLWPYKAGLGRAEIGRLGMYYHPPSDRIVVPVYEAGVPVFYQARAYDKNRKPKYIGPTPRPPRLMPRWGSAVSPTLTEDLLSAIKIGAVAEGIALLGTKVSDHIMALLIKRGSPVNVWTDPDEAGRVAAGKIMKQLRAYGVEARDILSARDPKLHTREEIKEILCRQ